MSPDSEPRSERLSAGRSPSRSCCALPGRALVATPWSSAQRSPGPEEPKAAKTAIRRAPQADDTDRPSDKSLLAPKNAADAAVAQKAQADGRRRSTRSGSSGRSRAASWSGSSPPSGAGRALPLDSTAAMFAPATRLHRLLRQGEPVTDARRPRLFAVAAVAAPSLLRRRVQHVPLLRREIQVDRPSTPLEQQRWSPPGSAPSTVSGADNDELITFGDDRQQCRAHASARSARN